MRFAVLLLSITVAAVAADDNWKLVWSDEFDGAKASAPDLNKWTYDLGANGWGNRELENYTKSRENSFLDGDGHLVIRAFDIGYCDVACHLETDIV